MIRSSYLTTLLAIVLCFATSASAQVTLKAKYPDGRSTTVVQQSKLAQTLKLKVSGMEIDQSTGAEQTMTVTVVNGKRANDGTLIVKAKINAIKAALSMPGGVELEFDSSDPDADPPGTAFDAYLDIFKATLNSTWTTTMNKDNRVVDIKGREAAFSDLPQSLQDNMKSQLDPEYLKTVANDELDRLPSTPVSSGDSWERTNLVRFEAGQHFTFTTKYTYKGSIEKDGKKLENIVFQVTDVVYDSDADSPVKVLESDLKVAKSEGMILFDLAAGQIVLEHSKVRLTGSLKLEANGLEIPADLDLTIEANSRLKIK